jgi:hypothetical protein
MTSSAAELQRAVFETLGASAGLTTLLGGAKIHDQAPAHVAFPYITFGEVTAADWSTATERGSELILTLHVWSKGQGKKELLAIMEAVRGLIDDAALSLSGHHLVSIRLRTAEARHDDDLALHHGLMRFRALCEAA